MGKHCNRCNQLKYHDEFSVQRSNKGGYSHVCKSCVVERNTEYWRTPLGRMSQIFAVQTVCSRQRKHPPPVYTRKELTDWAIGQGLFALVDTWRASGYEKDLSPSVDRLDANHGYSFGNIRLVTWKDNNEKAYEDRKSNAHVTKQNRKVRQLNLDGTFVQEFESIAAAARATGVQRTNINAMCKGQPQHKSVGGFLWEHAP